MYRTLSPTVKLFMLITITLFCVIGIGFFGIVEMQRMNRNTQTLYADRLLPVQQLNRVHAAYSNDIIAFADELTFSVPDKHIGIERLRNAQEIIDSNWHAYKRTYLTPEESHVVAETDSLKTIAASVISEFRANIEHTDVLTKAFHQKLYNSIRPVLSNIGKLMQLQVEIGNKISRDNQLQMWHSKERMLFIICVFLAAAIILTIIIVTDIRGLIRHLLESNERITVSSEQYYSLFQQIMDAIIVFRIEDGRIINANKSACVLLEYSLDELLALRAEDIVEPEELKHDPVDYNLTLGHMRVRERRAVTKSGMIKEVELQIQLIDNNRALAVARDVTELHKVQKQIELSESTLRNAFDYSGVGMAIVSLDGKFVRTNRRLQEIVKYTNEELLEKSFRDITHPDEHASDLLSLKKTMHGEIDSFNREKRYISKDGQIVWVNLNVSLVKDSKGNPMFYVSQTEDITERKKSEVEMLKMHADLAESESKFRSLVEQSLVGVFILQGERFIYTNPGFEKISGYTTAQLEEGLYLKDLVHDEDIGIVKEKYTTKISMPGISDHYIIKGVRGDGEIRNIEIISSVISYKGEAAMIGTVIDITDRVMEEKKIAQAVINAQERERLQVGMELHDNVQQIMAASLLNLDILKTYLDNRQPAVEMINQLKTYSSEAIAELRRLSHQLAPSIDSMLSLREKIRALTENMNIAGQLRIRLEVDEFKMELSNNIQIAIYRMVQEQLNNILKYAEASDVSIRIKKEKDFIVLTIEDDGKGFDLAQNKEGIGLENIRRRAHLLNGKSEIISAPGKGCKVIVHIATNAS